MRTPLVVAVGLLAASATVLLAHDLFLKLDSYFIPPNSAVNRSFSASEGATEKSYIKFIHMVAVRGDSVNYESKWATLTFQVR